MQAIIIVDCQNDFSDTGNLPVKGGTLLASQINGFIQQLNTSEYKFIYSRDWHPDNHISFKEWPIHCLKDTSGADYIPPLNNCHKDLEILKGTKRQCDSYSAFYENDNLSALHEYLLANHINKIYVCGLVQDVCVLHTANDAIKLGYDTSIITDLTIPLDTKRYNQNINPKVKEIVSQKII